jgi:hypothetical protein
VLVSNSMINNSRSSKEVLVLYVSFLSLCMTRAIFEHFIYYHHIINQNITSNANVQSAKQYRRLVSPSISGRSASVHFGETRGESLMNRELDLYKQNLL